MLLNVKLFLNYGNKNLLKFLIFKPEVRHFIHFELQNNFQLVVL